MESGVEVDLNVLNVSIPYLVDKAVLCCYQQVDALNASLLVF